MFRKLILASAVYLAVLPGAAGALGLGGIGAHSALGEPFAGQIELLDVTPDEIGTVKALLASEHEFNKVGAPRPSFLTGLSFTPVISPQGSPVILIASTEPVREPYVDFLIEVNSPAGRVVKEYTVLLDPPVTVDSRPPQVEQPVIESPAPQQAVRSESPRRQGTALGPSSADPSAFPMRYGPSESGDGLWRVARRMAMSSGASVAQTAMALYRSNQQAFIRGDINRLKVGKVLEIPTSAELLALDVGKADREFDAALRGESVTSTPLTDITAAPGPEDRLKIAGAAEPVSPTQARPEAPPETPPAEMAAQEGAAPGTAAGESAAQVGDERAPDLGAIKQDLLLVQEVGESTRQETTELRGRIRELETQLADIRRLLKLSNERFALLQAAGLELPEGLAPDGTDEAPPGDANAPGEGDSPKTAAAPTRDEVAPAEPQPDAGAGAPATGPVSSPGFWGSIPQPMSALAVVIPLLLLVLGWMIYKRRKSLEETPKPGELTSEASAVEGAVVATVDRLAEQSTESADVSAPMQSPYSGFGNLEDETEEADVVSEADVYIAYGRYREAESLLKEEVGKSPDRLDVKYKLAEACYGAGNLTGMEVIMSQIQRAGADRTNADQWRRLDGMLRDLKGADADRLGTSAGGAETHAAAAHEPAQPSGAFFPPPPDPASLEHGFPGAEDVLAAVPSTASSQDRRSQDLTLEVEGLDVVSGGLQTPASEEIPDMSGAASDLELRLEDLESLRNLDLAHFANEVSAVEPQSAEIETALSAEAERDALDIAPVGKDSLASDALSSQWRMDSGMWDEVATKIDLARAYMEMEDPNAARVILEEVEQEGNQDQRAEAREMMAQMS